MSKLVCEQKLISDKDLKRWLQRDLTRSEKVVLVVSTFDAPVKVSDIKAKAERVGCKMTDWNVADVLAKAKGMTIRLPSGYEVADRGHSRLHELGITKLNPEAAKVAHDLRKHLGDIKDETTKAFVDESIRCFEADLYRSAIVMAWLAAIGVLQQEVIKNHLAAFNAEVRRVDARWRSAITADDLGKLKESDFLDRLVAISMIGKNVKTELIGALNLRNGCGHPNSLKVGANMVAGHLELLLKNVFEKFSV